MRIEYLPTFIKDLKSLRGTPHFQKIHSLAFEEIQLLPSVEAIPNCSKLVGYEFYYRIRVGDYRIGFRLDGDTLVFMRVVHRKDIYRYFP